MDPDVLIPGTGIAALCNTNDSNFRVYAQDTGNGIRESIFSNGVWSGGDPASIIAVAKPLSPIAAVMAHDWSEIRVYFLNTNDVLQEKCWSKVRGFWYDGTLNQANIKVTPYSKLAAFVYNDKTTPLQLNLYAQRLPDNIIQEYLFHDPKAGWIPNESFSVGLAGGNIGATNSILGGHTSIYYQDANNNLVEYYFVQDGGRWQLGMVWSAQKPLCAVASTLPFESINPIVCFTTPDNFIQTWIYNPGKWEPNGQFGPVLPGTNCAVVWSGTSPPRVYVQDGLDGTAIREYDKNTASTWFMGAVVPPLQNDVIRNDIIGKDVKVSPPADAAPGAKGVVDEDHKN